MFTESQLFQNILNNEITSEGWTIERSDRDNPIAGRVVNIIKSDL